MVLKFVYFGVLVSLFASCSSEPKTGKLDKEKLPDGQDLFVQNCASCHGADGTLGMSGAEDLTKSKLNFAETKKIVENGNDNGMPRFKEMIPDESEMDAIIEYVLTLQSKK